MNKAELIEIAAKGADIRQRAIGGDNAVDETQRAVVEDGAGSGCAGGPTTFDSSTICSVGSIRVKIKALTNSIVASGISGLL